MKLYEKLCAEKLRNKDLQMKFMMQRFQEAMQMSQMLLKNGMENISSSMQMTQKTITFTEENMITNNQSWIRKQKFYIQSSIFLSIEHIYFENVSKTLRAASPLFWILNF